MFHIVLFEPEIPPNTGNIIRLCANTGCHLHLIKPLGFFLDDKYMKRAGLDYHEYASVKTYDSYQDYLLQEKPKRLFAIETSGEKNYSEIKYQQDDAFLFGPETRGLPPTITQQIPPEQILNIPMQPNNRSLNLSNSVAIVVYEAWRQLHFI
jgi:tRNA (cytidine/uridine-2'-O-)-methyltransferase